MKVFIIFPVLAVISIILGIIFDPKYMTLDGIIFTLFVGFLPNAFCFLKINKLKRKQIGIKF